MQQRGFPDRRLNPPFIFTVIFHSLQTFKCHGTLHHHKGLFPLSSWMCLGIYLPDMIMIHGSINLCGRNIGVP